MSPAPGGLRRIKHGLRTPDVGRVLTRWRPLLVRPLWVRLAHPRPFGTFVKHTPLAHQPADDVGGHAGSQEGPGGMAAGQRA